MTPSSVPAELGPADGYPTGPDRLVLIGPPGCGKTTAALECFALPVLRRRGLPERAPNEPPPPADLLMVSFSREAAGELRARLARAYGGRAEDYRGVVRTVHSEALRLLRGGVKLPRRERSEDDHDEDDGLPDMALGGAETVEQRATELRRAALRVWDLARHRLEREDLRTAFALADLKGYTLCELAAEIRAYEDERADREETDFTELLELALEVEPPGRELVLLDEAQDSSRLQWALVERWAAAARRFVAIGDPDQSIHRWCGASPERLLELARAHEVRRLGQSHRVPRTAHALARPLILLNRGRLDAPYLPADRDGTVLEVEQGEAVARVGEVAATGRDVLVVGRSSRVLSCWVGPLADAAVPFVNERGYGPLNGATRRAITAAVLDLREDHGKARTVDVKLLLGALPTVCFPPRRRTALRKEVGSWTSEFLTLEQLGEAGIDVAQLRAGTLREALLLAFARRKNRERAASDLTALVERHGREVLVQPPLVALTTAHGAKGREAALVVVDLELPKAILQGLAQPGATEVERQLLYVALTRTKDELLLVRHGRRDLGEELGLRPVTRRLGFYAREKRSLSCPDRTGERLRDFETKNTRLMAGGR